MKKLNQLIVSICVIVFMFALSACGTNNKTSKILESVATPIDLSAKISTDAIMGTIKKLSAKDDARITGFEGEAQSADYIAKQFKSMGYSVTEQKFPISAYRCMGTEIKIKSEPEKPIVSHYLSYSVATPKQGITANIVDGGLGTEPELNEAKVKNKLVLISRGGEYFRIKAERAYEMGAAGVVFYDPNQEAPIAATLMQKSSIPAISIKRSDAIYIKNLINNSNAKGVKISLKLESEFYDSFSKNIIAKKKSSTKSTGKNIVVGAHYDGVDTPAANDNASGIATVLEAARCLSKEKLDCEINFIAFGAEEIGLLGSEHYINSLEQEDISNIIAMLNLDMVGVGDTLYLHKMSDSSNSKLIDLTEEFIKKLDYSYERSLQANSDHVNFENYDIPVVYLEYGPYHNYHSDEDTIKFINKDNLFKTCNVVLELCYAIGKSPFTFAINN